MARGVDFCEYCNEPLSWRRRHVTVYRHRNGRHFIFEQVPARVCGRCGERYFTAPAVQQMDRLMRVRPRRGTAVSVPVISLRASA